MRKVKWFLVNGLFAAVVYAGLVEGIEGFRRLAYFFAWVNITISPFYLTDKSIETLKGRGGRSVPSWVNTTYDVGITVLFVWFGAWVTGAFWFLHWILQEAAWSKVKEAQ